ncbi:hypothetical protein M15_09190 [Atrimonas thermophila]
MFFTPFHYKIKFGENLLTRFLNQGRSCGGGEDLVAMG